MKPANNNRNMQDWLSLQGQLQSAADTQLCTNLTFVAPCSTVIYCIATVLPTRCTISKIYFILFWNNTLHVSDGLSVHHQESKTVHTATGKCHTGSVAAC